MYCNTKQMLLDARRNGYAVGAFNISNMEFAQAVINAAKETNTPVILQASESACKYAGYKTLATIVKCLAEDTDLPIALHLDHGKSFDSCKKAIDAPKPAGKLLITSFELGTIILSRPMGSND